MAEWLKAADCKSASECLRRFESCSLHHCSINSHFYAGFLLPKPQVLRGFLNPYDDSESLFFPSFLSHNSFSLTIMTTEHGFSSHKKP